VEGERKSDETKGKTERKEGNREDIHRQWSYKTRTRDTEETKNHCERKKRRESSKSRYRKITIAGFSGDEMKIGGDWKFFSRRRKMGWRKGRQREWKKDEQKGRWTKKMGTGK
jgi:hypothetical protein